MSKRLSEERVSNAFHTYLKSSLTQARIQQLLDAAVLSSAEADIMITGPALCLYFAALRSTTSPPSVPLPPSDKDDEPMDLTADNCPRPFIGFMETWTQTVPIIQSLSPEYQHDLSRIICGLEPLASPLHPDITRIGAELRAVAIEISQRRSFQDRYASDLQAALDASGGGRRVANFVPPPMYDASPSSSLTPSPNSQTIPLPPTSPSKSEFLSPTASLHPGSPRSHSQSRTRTPSPTPSSSFSPPPSPSFAVDAPSIQLIRETLYASLADVIARHRHVRRLLKSDPPRAYFAAVGLAILDVASTRTHVVSSEDGFESQSNAEPDVEVDGVLGAKLTLSACPRPLQPFMRELCMIGVTVRAAEEEDTMIALQALTTDSNATLPTPRMERVRRILERGVGSEHRRRHSRNTYRGDDDDDDDDTDSESEQVNRRQSIEGRAITLANRINALALGMLKLRAFRDRQNEIFKILASIVS